MKSIIDPEDKERLEHEKNRNRLFLHLNAGIHKLASNKWLNIPILAYLITGIVIWNNRGKLLMHYNSTFPLLPLLKITIDLFIAIFGIMVLIWLISLVGTPFGSKKIHDNLLRIGFTNNAGESPILFSKRKYVKNPRVIIMEFAHNGIPMKEWEEKRLKIEAALNLNIIKMKYSKNMRRIILYTAYAKNLMSKTLYWKDSYLSKENFVLVLGENSLDREIVRLEKTPHILLGGSTGSGKSVMLKLLVMQCVKKGATVYIADFKGGVDFSPIWHKKCKIVMEENALLDRLTDIVGELEKRKEILRNSHCENIDKYNEESEHKLQRIIFACDEVAEVLDKTGRSKESKELVTQIEGKLSLIARQGRAFGIHLILATQRPDATILSGQIRSNINFRACGRADSVLSQIILDNTDAADKISKDAQGQFVTHEGTVFQGYLFDESNTFEEP